MTDLVVLVLVVLWVAVLAPSAIRRVREGRSQTSIESFHEQLHLLERAGPKLVEPAYRLGSPVVPLRPQAVPAPAVDVTMGGFGGQGGLRLLEPPVTEVAERRRFHGAGPSPEQRLRGRRRRRDILLGLIATALLSGVAGAVGLHVLWVLTAISGMAIAGYVALAAYVQMLNADRQATRPVVSRQLERPPSPWAASRPRHAPGGPLPGGVEVLSAPNSWAAKAGYPGAWDDEALVARHAASGG